MVLGSSLILRRVDTDFVNISPILQFFGMDQPEPSHLPSSAIVTRGSSFVCGTWAPLATAQDLFRSHSFLNNFLSNSLHDRFPGSFQGVRQKATAESSALDFGSHFQSTVDAKRDATSSFRLELPPRTVRTPWELGMVPQWEVEDHLLSVHPPFTLGSASLKVASAAPDDIVIPETPLSPTEEAMFRVLCTAADWESAPPVDDLPAESFPMDLEPEVTGPELSTEEVAPSTDRAKERARPLRRSKRVAPTATTPRPCTRSATKRGAKSSRP